MPSLAMGSQSPNQRTSTAPASSVDCAPDTRYPAIMWHMAKTTPPPYTKNGALAETLDLDTLDRESVLKFFSEEHGLDLSERSDGQLAVFIRCEKRGGDVKSLLKSHIRLSQAMREVSPEEQSLWDIQLKAEGRL